MKIHTGDTVVVITGKDKGKTGTVMRTMEEDNRLVVEGINMRVKHIKKTPQQAGSKIKFEGAIAASNVMLVDPKTKKRTRVGYKIDEKGKKNRIAKVSGDVLKTASSVKAKTAKKDAPTKADAVPTVSKPDTKGAAPFWKRMGFGSKAQSEGGGPSTSPDSVKAAPTQHRAQGG